ncbi:hypothetical protein Tco_0173421 [Tanacetum coccineum]
MAEASYLVMAIAGCQGSRLHRPSGIVGTIPRYPNGKLEINITWGHFVTKLLRVSRVVTRHGIPVSIHFVIATEIRYPISERALRMLLGTNLDIEYCVLPSQTDGQKEELRDLKRKPMEFQVGDKVMLKVSPWKGVVRFGKWGKLNPRYVGPFKVIERVGEVCGGITELELQKRIEQSP